MCDKGLPPEGREGAFYRDAMAHGAFAEMLSNLAAEL